MPVNSTATAYVPARNLKSIRENNKSVSKSKGVTVLGMEDDSVVMSLESGNYRFVSVRLMRTVENEVKTN